VWLHGQTEQAIDLVGLQGFMLQEGFSQGVQSIPVLRQGFFGSLCHVADHPAHLAIDETGRVLAEISRLGDLSAQEDMFLALPESHRPEFVAHASLAYHAARQLSRLLEILRCPRRHIAERQLLRRPAAEPHGDAIEEILAREVVAILLGKLLGRPQGPTVGMIVTFCRGSVSGRTFTSKAWPAS